MGKTILNFDVLNAVIVFSLCLGTIHPAYAATPQRMAFPKTFYDEGRDLQLYGMGIKSVAFFKAFVAALYLEKAPASVNPLDDISKHLEVKYFVNIPGRKLNDFTVQVMKKNLTPGELSEINGAVDQMSEYFVDLKPGDRFSLSYFPGVGTKFAHNRKLVGVIKGKNFARALFSVWFGDKPFDTRLKNQMLEKVSVSVDEIPDLAGEFYGPLHE